MEMKKKTILPLFLFYIELNIRRILNNILLNIYLRRRTSYEKKYKKEKCL